MGSLDRAAELLAAGRAAGFSFTISGDKLIVAPASKLTDLDRGEIKQFRTEIIDILHIEQEDAWNAEIDSAVKEIERRIG